MSQNAVKDGLIRSAEQLKGITNSAE